MKRICFLVDSIFSFGGVQRVTSVIAKELARDYNVTIVTFDPPQTKDTSMYRLEEADLNYRFFAYPRISRLKQNCCRLYSAVYRKLRLQSRWASDLYALSSFPSELRNALAEELRQGKYDVIVGVHAPLAARLATLRRQLPGVRLLGWSHNSFEALFGKSSLYIGPEIKRHYVYQFRKLDKVVLLCQHDVATYRQYDPAFTPIYIYNPLTLTPGQCSDGSSRRFLAVGRFSHQHKGFDLLIKAFSLFAAEDSEWQLDIVGEGEEEQLYRTLIKASHLEDRVHIHPFTNDIQAYYSQAQVYVLSSRWEGFGLVLVEAMSHGLPVVSSNLPTSLEILGDFGLYFENGHVESLARQLQEATRIDWPAKSREAIAIAHRFDVDGIIGKWKSIIGQ